MSSLRILALSYIATALLFTLAIVLSDHAALRLVTMEAGRSLTAQIEARVIAPILLFARLKDEEFLDPQVRVTLPAPREQKTAALPPRAPQAVTAPQIETPAPVIIMPDLPLAEEAPDAPSANPSLGQGAQLGVTLGEGYGGHAPSQAPVTVSPALPSLPPVPQAARKPAPVPPVTNLTAAQRDAVRAQLVKSLTPVMLEHFDLFLYVSKAKSGPLAQRLYVFQKDAGGVLTMAHDWPASTGREQLEVSPLGRRTRTNTPPGFFQLDPSRMYRAYHSRAWDQSMPYAMFFNWEVGGDQTGFAIHSATGDDIAKLGARASAGCVHLSPEHARQLFGMIRADYKGKVPRFAYERGSDTMNRDGVMMRGRKGELVMAEGYRVLIDIEDFSGTARVAALN